LARREGQRRFTQSRFVVFGEILKKRNESFVVGAGKERAYSGQGEKRLGGEMPRMGSKCELVTKGKCIARFPNDYFNTVWGGITFVVKGVQSFPRKILDYVRTNTFIERGWTLGYRQEG